MFMVIDDVIDRSSIFFRSHIASNPFLPFAFSYQYARFLILFIFLNILKPIIVYIFKIFQLLLSTCELLIHLF